MCGDHPRPFNTQHRSVYTMRTCCVRQGPSSKFLSLGARFLWTWRWRRMFEKFTARMVLPAVNDEFVDEMFSVGRQITLLMPRHDIPSSDRCPAVHKR